MGMGDVVIVVMYKFSPGYFNERKSRLFTWCAPNFIDRLHIDKEIAHFIRYKIMVATCPEIPESQEI